jgi:hypothetical protein
MDNRRRQTRQSLAITRIKRFTNERGASPNSVEISPHKRISDSRKTGGEKFINEALRVEAAQLVREGVGKLDSEKSRWAQQLSGSERFGNGDAGPGTGDIRRAVCQNGNHGQRRAQ